MYVLEAEMIASAGGWEVEREEKRVRENFKFFGLSDCKGGVDIFRDGESMDGTGWEGSRGLRMQFRWVLDIQVEAA